MLLSFASPAGSDAAEWKNVLILNSYHQGYKWTDDETRGILSTLNPGQSKIKVSIQYLDTKRASDSHYFESMRDIFDRKFRNARFDVIITTDNDAFNFMKTYRDDLFPGTPVVFCGINYLKESDLEASRLFTGVNEDADIAAGIDLILKLHPDTEKIVAVTDTSVTGRAVRGELEKVLSAHSGKVRHEILDDITMPDLQLRISGLTKGTVVFYTFFFRDSADRVFEYDESAKLISSASPVPVYGAWDFSFGFGIVGGILTSGFEQGKTAGALALRILQGEDPAGIPIVWHSPGTPMFDFQKISSLHISKSQLPPGSFFINEPPSVLSIDKTIVWGVLWSGFFITGLFLVYVLLQKRAEMRLRSSEEKYRTLVDNLHIGVYRSTPDPDGRFIQVNPAMVEMLGYASAEELMRVPVVDIYAHPDGRASFLDEMRRLGGVRDRELHFRRKDGSLLTVSGTATAIFGESGNLQYIDGVNEDVTEKRSLEAQLRQAQKMEAIGTLAGGVAHDFNNILTAILGYANLLYHRLQKDPSLKTYANNIIAASEKAAQLTKSLLAFSRKQIISPGAVNVNDIAEHMHTLLPRVIPEDIELKMYLADEPLPVYADSTQIEQVLMNLVTNARDAMPDGGTITIETEKVMLSGEVQGNQPLGYAMMAISDTGEGMDEDIRTRIFEPFFTTKDIDKGTGLGLSMAYGIVKQHNGEINVYSERGKGTTFRIYLPLTEHQIAQCDLLPVRNQQFEGGTETIMVVEDHTDVRELTGELLTGLGYRVIQAANGEEAIELFRAKFDRIDLVIMDVIMPKMNGQEVYRELQAIRSDVRVLFTSGYTRNIIQSKGILAEEQNFLSKPASPSAIAGKVREILSRPAHS